MSHEAQTHPSSRRAFLAASALGVAAITACQAAPPAGAAAEEEHVHSDPKNENLTRAALECARVGEDCIAHAFDLIKAGDTTLAQCADLNAQTTAATIALAKLSAADSKHLKAFAKVVGTLCRDCEEECLKHDHHMACMLSAQACKACAEACEAAVA